MTTIRRRSYPLTAAVGAWVKSAGHSVSLSSSPSAEAFLFAYEENAAFDILLSDIEVGSMNGVVQARLRPGIMLSKTLDKS